MPPSCPVFRPLLLAGAAGLLLSLPACSGVKQALGVEPTAPDEFQVVARAPLSMPPDYTLRPPRPGARRVQDAQPTDQARQTVFRVEEKPVVPPSSDRSPGEAALLKEAGAGNGDSDIRQLLARDYAGSRKVEERGFVDRLLFWRAPEGPKEMIDPGEEARRLGAKDGAAAPVEPKTDGPKDDAPSPPEPVPGAEKSENPLFDRLFR